MIKILKYKTEKGFHHAMARWKDYILQWYGVDHFWVIEIQQPKTKEGE